MMDKIKLREGIEMLILFVRREKFVFSRFVKKFVKCIRNFILMRETLYLERSEKTQKGYKSYKKNDNNNK